MKIKLRVRAAAIFFAIVCTGTARAADVAFTANLKSYSGTAASASYLNLVLINCSDADGRNIGVTASGVVAAPSRVLLPNSAGVVSATITPNADITCGIIAGQSRYRIEVRSRRMPGVTDPARDLLVSAADYVVGGAGGTTAFNLATASPVSPASLPSQVDYNLYAVTRPFRRLAYASFPASCTALKDWIERSDPATAGQVLYRCNSAGNGWNLVGDGGSGGGAVDSVFGRTGTVVAANNDYTWAQINKATSSIADIATRSAGDLNSGTLPDGRFPSTLPAVSGANLTSIPFSNLSGQATTAQLPSTIDFTGKTATAPNKSGTTPPATCSVGDTFFDTDATAGQNVYGCTATNTWTVQGDGGGGGSGINTLNGLTATSQTFAKTDDTNVTLSITSTTSTHTFALGWTGTLAKARQHAATVYNDAGNTWSTGAQDFGSATSLKIPTGAGAAPTANGLLAYDSTANLYKFGANGATKTIVTLDDTQTLTGKTLTTPTIGSFANANHNHTNSAGGGQLTDAALSAAVTVAKGGTGATSLTGYVKGNGTSPFTAASTVPLTDLAAQAADTVVLNASGSSAAPAAVAMPTSGTNGCAGSTNALTYNTTTHALGCNNISGAISGLTTGAIVTAASSTTIQTPNTSATMDSSGNISTPGTISSGVGSSTAGFYGLGQGTAQSTVTSTIGLSAPTSVTAYNFVFPGAAGNGFLSWSNSSNIVTGVFRSMAATSPVTITNADGTAGNPTLACATCVTSAASLTSGKVVEGAGSQATAVSTLTATVVKASSGTLSAATAGTDYVSPSSTETLTNKTLTTPTIGSFANANHNHTNSAGGGQLTDAALSAAVTVAKGGTGATSLTGYVKGSGTSALTASATVPLSDLAAQAADTVVLNASGSSAAPAAVAMPTSGTNGCAGSSNALTYNTTTHALGCNTIAGSGTINSGVTNIIPKYTASTTLDDSLLSDDGTALSYSGSGGIVSAPGTAAGLFGIGQGTAQSTSANKIGLTGPTSITAYNMVFPGAAGSGFLSWSNSSNIVTAVFRSLAATSPVTVSNADGTAGNPTLACATCVTSAASLTSGKVVEGAGSQATAVSTLTATVVKASSGTLSAATAGTDYVSPSSTETLTNKTLDAEGTGNTITTVSKVWMPAAGCASTTGALLWDTLATNAPTATCSAGSTETTLMRGVADFPDSDGDYSLQQGFMLPSDWSGNIDLKFLWRAAATSGDVVWQATLVCRADAEVDDAAFNSANTVTDTAKGTTLQLNTASITSMTTTTCAAGEYAHLKVFRNRTNGSDTITGVISLAGVEVTMRRAQ